MVGLLTYAVSLVILVAYLAVPFLQETRGVLIALCLLTFSAGKTFFLTFSAGKVFCLPTLSSGKPLCLLTLCRLNDLKQS